MPFIPLARPSSPTDFPRVSSAEQAARDSDAESILVQEFDQAMPADSRKALENEYKQRFGKQPPGSRRGFVPLSGAGSDATPTRGFKPLPDEKKQPSILGMALLENPLTAIAETGANLASQAVAIPAAGLAGLATEAGNAMGLTEKRGADVVLHVGEAMTYQPRGEMGKAATEAVTYPFQKLNEAATWVGNKTLEATDSPALATTAHTLVEGVAPLMAGPLAKKSAALMKERIAGKPDAQTESVSAKTQQRAEDSVSERQQIESAGEALRSNDLTPAPSNGPRGFVPLEAESAGRIQAIREGDAHVDAAETGAQRLANHDPAVHRSGTEGLAVLRGRRDQGVSAVDGELRSVFGRHGAGAEPDALVGAVEREGPLRASELRLDDASAAVMPQGKLPDGRVGWATHDHRGGFEGTENRSAPFQAADSGAGAIRSGSGESRSLAETKRTLDDIRRGDLDGEPMEPTAQRAANASSEAVVRGVASGSDIAARAAAMPNIDSLRASIDRAAHEAATSPLNDKPQPTLAQIEAGTYPKGHIRLHGLDIAIESPKGAIRAGVSPEGAAWETTMQDHYGYVKRTMGKDGDPVDVFIADKPGSERVFVIDQIDPRTGKFDEHKAVMGAETVEEAKAIYQRNYESGWGGAGAISEMALPEFKEWLRSADTKKPVGIGRVLGKEVTEISDRTLAKMLDPKSSMATAGKARAIVEAETARRKTLGSGKLEKLPRTAIGKELRKFKERKEGKKKPQSQVRNAWAPGHAHTGFINDAKHSATLPASGAKRSKPMRREDVLVEFAKALGTSIYEGRVKGKNRLGFFRPGVQETRIKRHADLETAAHEMAHLIDEQVPEISQAWKSDKALEKELRSISYDATKVYEGFAEGVRLWMTQPEVLQTKAPKVSAWLDRFVDSHAYGPAMKKAQAGMTEWFGQDAIDRARSKIGDHRPLSDALDGIFDRFRQSVTDDLHGIYRMERELRDGKLAPVGAYESARLSRASASIADGAVRYGHPVKKGDGSFSFAGKGLEEILKPVGERLDDFLLYAVGRSAGELMAQGREHLFTQGEIRAMQALETPEFKKAFAGYLEWNKGILDFAEAQGIINPEARRLWQRTQYLPFHRVGQAGGVKGKPGDWSGVQALTGGTENIRDVLGNMVGNAAMLIDKAVKNEARVKVADLAEQQGGGKFMARIDTESRPVKVSGDQVLRAMLEKYGIALDGEVPGFFEFLIHGQPPAGGNVVAVLKGGKPVWYEVADPILYRALQAIDRPNQHWLTKWLGMPKRVGQATITLTPDFMLANLARDTIMGGVMSRSGFRPFVDSVKGMRLRLTGDPLYKEFIANGGGLSSIYLDEGKLRHKLEKFYNRQGIDYQTVLDSPDKLLSFVETLGDTFETSTRLGEYKRAIENGEHPRHAAYLGREVSTDFAAKGDSKALGFMYDTVMFLRPAVVSMDRLYRGVAHDPNKAAIGAKTGLLALSSVALYLLNRDDPRYQDLPDWDRDANWHFFVGDQHFRYPKIWEIGAVASVAERTTEKLMQDDTQGLGKDFARIIGHTFNLNLMPQILAPLYEQATNRNSFTKAPIETPGLENVQPFLRAKPTTSETLKAAGLATRNLPESLQLNPVRAEALLRGYFNTWGLYGLALSDKAFFGDQLPETRTDKMPVIRRFYSQEPPLHTKYETMFYEMLGEAKRLQGTLRELDRIGRPDIADEKEQSPMAGEAKPLARAAKNLQEINAEMRQVRRGSNLSPAEKRQKLDALTVERNALLKAAVLDAQSAQKAKAE